MKPFIINHVVERGAVITPWPYGSVQLKSGKQLPFVLFQLQLIRAQTRCRKLRAMSRCWPDAGSMFVKTERQFLLFFNCFEFSMKRDQNLVPLICTIAPRSSFADRKFHSFIAAPDENFYMEVI